MNHARIPYRLGSWKRTVVSVILVLLISTLLLAAEEDQGQGKLGFWEILAFPRYWMAAIFSVIGLVLLIRNKVSWNLRTAFLPVIFFVFAVIYGLPWGTFAQRMGQHPSPVCMITKPFLFLEAGKAVPTIFGVSLLVFGILTIVGNKLFCGWVCPVGAFQELVNRIPLPKKLRVKIPFKVTNSIRFGVFAVFLIVAFTAGFEIYEYFNPFEFLHWRFEALAIGIFAGTFVAALFIWRPFCYFLCPMGLLSWLLEQVSLVRVKVNRPQCDDCNVCVVKAPCPAVPSILEERRIRPDCFACGRCLDACPREGLSFRV